MKVDVGEIENVIDYKNLLLLRPGQLYMNFSVPSNIVETPARTYLVLGKSCKYALAEPPAMKKRKFKQYSARFVRTNLGMLPITEIEGFYS